MGTISNAILLYGIHLVEDAFEEYYEYDEAAEQSGPAYMAFMGTVEDGCCIQHHQSNEYTKYFVALHGSIIVAHRGFPQLVNQVEIHDGGRSSLWRFVEKYGLECEGKVGWYLASWWG